MPNFGYIVKVECRDKQHTEYHEVCGIEKATLCAAGLYNLYGGEENESLSVEVHKIDIVLDTHSIKETAKKGGLGCKWFYADKESKRYK